MDLMLFKKWYFWVILILAVMIAIKIINPTLMSNKSEFCGESTLAYCSTDENCFETGCSSEVCASKSQSVITTDCVWRTCYNEEMYGLSCQCISNQCQWSENANNNT